MEIHGTMVFLEGQFWDLHLSASIILNLSNVCNLAYADYLQVYFSVSSPQGLTANSKINQDICHQFLLELR